MRSKVWLYTPDEKWYLGALVLNGWQRIKRLDGNSTPSFGTQLTWKPNKNVTLNSSTFIGNDKPDSVRKMRNFHNFYGIFQLNEKWFTTVGFDIGAEQKAKGSSKFKSWYSPILIIKFNATDKLSLAARAEYYHDKNEVIISTGTQNGFQTTGFSANVNYTIQKNVLWRIEARSLKSMDNIFEKGSSALISNCLWMATSLSISF